MLYYLAHAGIAIGIQKYLRYDKPNGSLYKIIDFPMALPGVLFDRFVPLTLKKRYFRLKPGYLRKAAICFIANVTLYTLPAYLLLVS